MSLGTALALKSAVSDSLMDGEVMLQAAQLAFSHESMNIDDFIAALESLSYTVAASAIARATTILMSEDEFVSMVHEIAEVEGMDA